EKIKVSDLPRKVVEAVKAKFPDAKLTGAEKEKKGEETVYEVQITVKKQKIEVTANADGKILSIEKQIGGKDPPAAVTKTLEEKYPKATYKIIEEVTEGKKKYYEVLLVTADKKTFEVEIAPNGKFIKATSKDKKKEEKDK